MRESARPFTLEGLTLGEPRAGELVVRMEYCGICHTDIACRDGVIPLKLPMVLGHEGAGVVEAVGPGVADIRPGDHVLLTFASCGGCACCATAHPAYCDQFNALNFSGGRADGSTTLHDGAAPVHSLFFGQSAFATHAVVSRSSVLKVDADLPKEILAPLGCGVQTGAGAVLNTLKVRPGQSIAVFGAGGVGMSAIMAAAVAGCTTIIAVDLLDDRLDLATELGATHRIRASAGQDLAETVRAILPQGVDHVVDSTGNGQVVAQAIRSLARRGTCALVGMYPPGQQLPLDIRQIVLNGIAVKGVVEGDSNPSVFIDRLIDLYRAGRFPLDRLVTVFPFAAINDAMEAAASGRVIKPVLKF